MHTFIHTDGVSVKGEITGTRQLFSWNVQPGEAGGRVQPAAGGRLCSPAPPDMTRTKKHLGDVYVRPGRSKRLP